MMDSSCGRRFTTPRFEVHVGSGMGPFDSPPMGYHIDTYGLSLTVLGKTQLSAVLPYCHRVRPSACIIVVDVVVHTKWGSRISGKVWPESPNFTQTFTSVGSTTTLDMTSLRTSGWQLPKFKNGRKYRNWRLRCCISRETFELKSPNFTSTSMLICHPLHLHRIWRHELLPVGSYSEKNWWECRLRRLQVEYLENRLRGGSPNFTWLSWITGSTNMLDITSLVASGRLQNAIKYWTKVIRKTGPAGQIVK